MGDYKSRYRNLVDVRLMCFVSAKVNAPPYMPWCIMIMLNAIAFIHLL